MTIPTPTRSTTARLAIWLAALALPSVGLAAAPVTIDAAGVPFASVESGDVVSAGVDLAYAGGWVLAFGAAGEGALGDAIVGGVHTILPVDALGGVAVGEALARVVLVEYVGDGVTFVLEGGSPGAFAASFAAAFEGLGGDVEADLAHHVLTVTTEDGTLRAVFGAEDDGVRVYLGS